MSNNQKFITYGDSFSNNEGEDVSGLHIMRSPNEAVMISHRVASDSGTEVEPFYLPDEPAELRKIAKALRELADDMEGKKKKK